MQYSVLLTRPESRFLRLATTPEVIAKVTAIVDSVTGRKIYIAFGAFALKVDESADYPTRELARRSGLS